MFTYIAFLALSMCLILSPAVYGLDIGNELLNDIGQVLDTKDKQKEDGEEIAVGRQIAGNLLGASPLVKDRTLQKYVNRVGRWVANQGERPDLRMAFRCDRQRRC